MDTSLAATVTAFSLCQIDKTENMIHTVYLSLGTNLGNLKANMHMATDKIEELIGTVVCRSALYETKPWGFDSQNNFLNACICVSTPLLPHELLEKTQDIERMMGRLQKSQDGVYHDRVIDIDILLYDNEKMESQELTIPHPLMLERDFVMVPLREIYPEVDQVLEKLNKGF